MNSTQQQVINSAKTIQNEDSKFFGSPSLIVGLRLILPGDLSTDPTPHMCQYFFGDYVPGTVQSGVASSGSFRYLPLDKSQINDQFFCDSIKDGLNDSLNAIFDQRVKLVDGNTQIEIMVNTEAYESFEDEIGVVSKELNLFVESGFCVSWEQIDLTQ
jgi:hypothetical protein